ncbi:ATP-binding cassette domain-containing protein [Paenibacillus sp. SGZ-1009]|uniref:ATP-binding cassette domain-containing protein n=1 Tax=Paenibacillus campi TaxID=3106031 RepID=UPI002AFFC6C9|nr:ATP-binding cassette domain-containing protein [Paenibacillus sp. SGZ-1009]
MTVTEQQPFLRIHNVQKQFGTRTILEQINIDVQRGQFIAIVGRSGCGKSTLLRMIAGLEQASNGQIELSQRATTAQPSSQNVPSGKIGSKRRKPIREQQTARPNTRFLFQEARLLPWKTVLDNVRLGIPDKSKQHASEALQLVGLAEREQEWPSILSGGQRQRVALARALASHPDLLLLDEPLGALDALTRIEMQKLIERLWIEQGLTVVLVTHDVSEAVALADRVVLIEQGRIALDIRITLDRPRERDSGFAHFENLILQRLLQPGTQPHPLEQQRQPNFSI